MMKIASAQVRQDVSFPEMGGFRWLTVGPPGQDDVSIVLMALPGPPIMDTENCQASYEELAA